MLHCPAQGHLPCNTLSPLEKVKTCASYYSDQTSVLSNYCDVEYTKLNTEVF